MNKLIHIERNQRHKMSIVICLRCYHRWLAVRPEKTKLVDLECNRCGQGYVIETGEVIEE